MMTNIGDYWMIYSETDKNIMYKVEKTVATCHECVLHCDICHICIHKYKCMCKEYDIHLNICKHIDACTRENKSIQLYIYIFGDR